MGWIREEYPRTTLAVPAAVIVALLAASHSIKQETRRLNDGARPYLEDQERLSLLNGARLRSELNDEDQRSDQEAARLIQAEANRRVDELAQGTDLPGRPDAPENPYTVEALRQSFITRGT